MDHERYLKHLFSSIDEKDVNNFSALLTEDCSFRFGNSPTVFGKENVASFVSAFFDSIDSLSHTLIESSSLPDRLFCHGIVSYTRHDQSVLSVPFSNIFKLKGDLISEYLIFADTSAL